MLWGKHANDARHTNMLRKDLAESRESQVISGRKLKQPPHAQSVAAPLVISLLSHITMLDIVLL